MTIGSLFSGIGGLELGLESLGLGPVLWQCDSDPLARAVLAKHWPNVTRYEDVRKMDGATRVSLVCGGFPCQPHSLAGKRKGTSDERWLWPAFAAIIERARPLGVFIENVPGLRTSGLRDVLAGLADLGFDAEWDYFSAAEVGAPHIRRRLFILAHTNGEPFWLEHRRRRGQGRKETALALLDGGTGNVADAYGTRLEVGSEQSARQQCAPAQRGRAFANPWPVEPDVGRVAYGVPARAHRLRLLGNSCVPQQAALAFRTLAARVAQ